MNGHGWSRRSFLRAWVGATLGVLVGGLGVRSSMPPPPAVRLAAVLPSASAAAVGRAYLAAHPSEADAARLVRALAQTVDDLDRLVASAGDAQLRRSMLTAIRCDFAAERVVAVRGWMLSLTEARLCALAAIADRTS